MQDSKKPGRIWLWAVVPVSILAMIAGKGLGHLIGGQVTIKPDKNREHRTACELVSTRLKDPKVQLTDEQRTKARYFLVNERCPE